MTASYLVKWFDVIVLWILLGVWETKQVTPVPTPKFLAGGCVPPAKLL